MIRLKLIGKPRDADYLTPGKVYEAEVSLLISSGSALIVDDTGEKIQISLLSCPHARPAKWEEVQNDH